MLIINVYDAQTHEEEKIHRSVSKNVDGSHVWIRKGGGVVEQMVEGIKKIALKPDGTSSTISMLRLFFHGQESGAGIAFRDGEEGLSVFVNSKTKESTPMSFGFDENILKELKIFFDKKSSTIEVHSCNSGRGKSGQDFTQMLADFLEVKVIAGQTLQTHNDSKFEGDKLTIAYPGGKRPVSVENTNSWSLESLNIKYTEIWE